MDSKVLNPPPRKIKQTKKQFHKKDAECDSVLCLSHAGRAGSAAVSGGPEALLSRPLLSALLRYNSYTSVCLLRLQVSGLGFVLYHNITRPSPLILHFHNLTPLKSSYMLTAPSPTAHTCPVCYCRCTFCLWICQGVLK